MVDCLYCGEKMSIPKMFYCSPRCKYRHQGVEEATTKFLKELDEFGDAITGLLHKKPRGDIQFTWNDAIGKVMEMRNEHFGEYLKERDRE